MNLIVQLHSIFLSFLLKLTSNKVYLFYNLWFDSYITFFENLEHVHKCICVEGLRVTLLFQESEENTADENENDQKIIKKPSSILKM